MEYCRQTGQVAVPVSDIGLQRYVAYLAGKLSYVSIGKYLNIINILHRESGRQNPLEDNWVVKAILRGVKRDKGAPSVTKLPITPDILLGFRSQLDLSQPRDIILWAACLVAFFGLLRKSNLLPRSAHLYDSSKHLSRNDLVLTPQGYLLTVKWSKTIQFREKELKLILPWIPGHPLCPMTAVTMLLALSPTMDKHSPLFSSDVMCQTALLTQGQFVSGYVGYWPVCRSTH